MSDKLMYIFSNDDKQINPLCRLKSFVEEFAKYNPMNIKSTTKFCNVIVKFWGPMKFTMQYPLGP